MEEAMFGKRCSLCGGKLNSNGICTECGLDNNKSDKNYDAWKEKATYFNTEELYEVMLGLVKNENLNRMTRGYACKPVAVHCTKEQFEEFGKVVNDLTDKDAKFIQDEYQNQAKKLE